MSYWIYTQLCYKENDDCPITSLKFSNNGILTNISRNISQKPITSMTISINGPPCLISSDYSLYKSNPPYTMLNINDQGCGGYDTNKEIQFIDVQSEFNLYKDNNMQGIVNILPGYQANITNNIVYLSYTTRFRKHQNMTIQCEIIQLDNFSSVSIFLRSIQHTILIGSIIEVIINLIFFTILCRALVHQNGNLREYSKIIKNNHTYFYMFMALFISIILFERVVQGIDDQINLNEEYFTSVGLLDCFENVEISEVLIEFGSQLPLVTQSIMHTVGLFYWFSIISLIFILFGLTYKFFYRNCM